MPRAALIAIAVLAVAAPAAPAASPPPAQAKAGAFPSPPQIRSALDFARARRGTVGLALIDTGGRLHGHAPRRVFASASVVKAMLLVAYLRRAGGRLPSVRERRVLGPMITRSSNGAASAVYRRLGAGALRGLAARAGMRSFSAGASWAGARFSAADQARFIRRFDRLTPLRSRGYARRLMSSIVRRQRWGFSRFAARAGWGAYFKGGWRRTGSGRLVHEVALFERRGRRFSLAVLSDGGPSHAYGTATLRGVASRLFVGSRAAPAADTPALRRAGLADLRRFAPQLRLDLRYATARNLTGRRLPGYCRPWALMLGPAARDLGRVERTLNRRGLALSILDAYRPARASRALVRWARRSGRGDLVGTYIAARSRHNQGSAVDLTLVRRRDGRALAMGTRYDDLSSRAHTLNARGRTLRNRLTLVRAMQRHGFRNYTREWWHFEHRVRGSRYLDLSLGCET